RKEKNNLILSTFLSAISFKDPSSFTDYTSLHIETSFISRIFKINQDRNLKINFNDFNNKCCTTALIVAVNKNLKSIVKKLVEHKEIDINCSDSLQETALHHVNDPEIAALLLSNGAIQKENEKGRTPIFMAAKNDNVAVMQILYQDISEAVDRCQLYDKYDSKTVTPNSYF